MFKFAFAAAVALFPLPALAGTTVATVPEIDALSGLGAIAAVGAVAALVWERRRR